MATWPLFGTLVTFCCTVTFDSIEKAGAADQGGRSLGHSVVVVTDGPRDFPGAVFALPQMNELSLADWLRVVMPRVVEAVNTHLNRAIAPHGIDLQTAWNEFSGHFAADILLYAIGQFLFAKCHSTLIVKKLHIVGKEGSELLQIATVVGIEQRRVERCDHLVKFLLGLNAFQRLGVCTDDAQASTGNSNSLFGSAKR